MSEECYIVWRKSVKQNVMEVAVLDVGGNTLMCASYPTDPAIFSTEQMEVAHKTCYDWTRNNDYTINQAHLDVS